ncbi:MAG TPA: pantoate--beta-alanine ligase [Gammaproteobacteria bacterium]|nr:pantoate--beta-alanine ligase [Gammaproteobacteria bacterium]
MRTVSSVRELVGSWRSAHQTVALVPTMGNLHPGHLSLAQIAAETVDKVVLSIFVNPAQFGPGEDFAAYPRTFDDDWARVAEAGTVDALFVPEVAEIYPFGADQAVRVAMPPLSRELCGASRPGHFDGVATVVCRLLNVVAPDVLVLGQKDYQQFILMERMAADLRLPVSVIRCPIQRESDGLAMSSRNRYLTAAQRLRAGTLHATLQHVRSALQNGTTDYHELEAQAMSMLAEAGLRPEYVEVRRAADLTKARKNDRPDQLVILAAAWLGRARLIDNVLV